MSTLLRPWLKSAVVQVLQGHVHLDDKRSEGQLLMQRPVQFARLAGDSLDPPTWVFLSDTHVYIRALLTVEAVQQFKVVYPDFTLKDIISGVLIPVKASLIVGHEDDDCYFFIHEFNYVGLFGMELCGTPSSICHDTEVKSTLRFAREGFFMTVRAPVTHESAPNSNTSVGNLSMLVMEFSESKAVDKFIVLAPTDEECEISASSQKALECILGWPNVEHIPIADEWIGDCEGEREGWLSSFENSQEEPERTISGVDLPLTQAQNEMADDSELVIDAPTRISEHVHYPPIQLDIISAQSSEHERLNSVDEPGETRESSMDIQSAEHTESTICEPRESDERLCESRIWRKRLQKYVTSSNRDDARAAFISCVKAYQFYANNAKR